MVKACEWECVSHLIHNEKVHRNDREHDDDMHLNVFIESCEIRKMIENMKQKSVGDDVNEHEISAVCFVCHLL